MKKIRLLTVFALVITGLVVTTGVISAAPDPFVCPIVGDGGGELGVINADAHTPEGKGLVVIDPAAGASVLPGNEQGGVNANSTAYNDRLPNDPDSGPGDGNSGFTAIWSDNPATP